MNTRLIFKRPAPFLVGIFLGVLFTAYLAFTSESFKIDQETLAWAEAHYGREAQEKLLAWEKLIREDNSATVREKLDKVNHFFNMIHFVSDSIHWNKEDYWATPVEFLSSNGGDCEDFSIAKYFTLKAMGVSEQKLNLTYVQALQLNQAHMVITYYEKPGAEPLVLDNLTDKIQPASKRTDLLPVYSFNGTGLWIAKQRGKGKFVGKSDRLGRWQELLQRMPQGFIR